MREECLVVEIRVEGDGCPLADASRETGVEVDARPPQLRDDGHTLRRFSAPPDDGLAEILDADDRIRYLHVARGEDRYEFRCLSMTPCVVHELVSVGFLADTLYYRDGVGRFTGAVVGYDVLQGVMDRAGETVGVRLERTARLGPEDGTAASRRFDLTVPQEEALRKAFAMGYFAVPRGTTASAVADELGISKSAFLERIRRAQGSLFGQLLGEA